MNQIRRLIARFDGPSFRSHEDRAMAIEELQQLGPEGQQCLLQLFADSDPETRMRAATTTIVTFGLTGQTLILPLLHDTDSNVRYHICGLLYDFGDSDAVPALVERL